VIVLTDTMLIPLSGEIMMPTFDAYGLPLFQSSSTDVKSSSQLPRNLESPLSPLRLSEEITFTPKEMSFSPIVNCSAYRGTEKCTSRAPPVALSGYNNRAGKSKRKGNVQKEGEKKRPPNAFILWSSKYGNRRRIKGENPDLSNNTISKLLGVEWAALGRDGQSEFRRESKRLKEAAQADGYEQGLSYSKRAKKKLLPMARKLWPHTDIMNTNVWTLDFELLAQLITNEIEREIGLKRVAKTVQPTTGHH